MKAADIITIAIRDAVRAEARELRPSRQDQIADAAIAAVAPYVNGLASLVSRGYARAAGKGAASVDQATSAALSPTTTKSEAGVP